jgi:hypothetical protein
MAYISLLIKYEINQTGTDLSQNAYRIQWLIVYTNMEMDTRFKIRLLLFILFILCNFSLFHN